MACKTIKLSLSFQGYRNFFMVFGWTSMYLLSVGLAYIEPINHIFGTRDLMFEHYYMPAVPFSILILLYDEVRKYLIRNFKQYDKSKPNWFARNA